MPTAKLARPASHPFYARLNALLDESKFDEFVEEICQPFYATTIRTTGIGAGNLLSTVADCISEASIASGASRGGRRIRWASALFCKLLWTKRGRITPPSREPGG